MPGDVLNTAVGEVPPDMIDPPLILVDMSALMRWELLANLKPQLMTSVLLVIVIREPVLVFTILKLHDSKIFMPVAAAVAVKLPVPEPVPTKNEKP